MKRSMYYLMALSLLFISVIGCFDFPEEIILPEWDVDLNVPITNKTYTIYDMFKPKSEYSITTNIGSDDFYLVKTDDYVSNSDVTDYIKVLDQGVQLENFIIPANIPAQSVFIVFQQEIEIDHATFLSGFLSFSIQNPSSASITSHLHIPGIIKPDGSELVIESTIAASSSDSIVYSLANHRYILPANQPVQNKNSLQVVASANSPLNESYEYVNFYLYDFNFSSITGSLPRTSLGNKRTSSSFDLDDAVEFRDKLFIKEGSLNLKAEYVSDDKNIFDLEITDVKIIGIRSTGEEKFLIPNDGQKISFKLISGVHNLLLDENNSNIVDFISFLPDSVVITSQYILNPLNNHVVRTVTNKDSVKFSIQLNTKSIFAIKQSYFVDTIAIDFSEEDREKIRDGVKADLNVNLENAIPIDAYIKATLTDENYASLFTLTRNEYGVDSLQFLGSQVDNNTGAVILPTVTLNTISLNNEKISQFSNARYIIISTTVNTKNALTDNPNPPTVQFKSSDWLNIKCYGAIKYHVNPEGE